MICKHLFTNKFDLKKILNILLVDGEKLFIKYNYLTFSTAFIILFLGFSFGNYLSNLYVNYNSTYDEYKSFINYLEYFINCFFWLLILFYLYTFISFLIHNVNKANKENKVISLDAIVINFIYFTILSFEINFINIRSTTNPYVYFSAASLIVVIYFLCKKEYKVMIESWKNIVLKSILFLILAFFVINYKYVLFSRDLILQDIKNNITMRMKEVAKKKQTKLIKYISKYFEHNISNNNIQIYTNKFKSEVHIIITDKQLIKGLK